MFPRKRCQEKENPRLFFLKKGLQFAINFLPRDNILKWEWFYLPLLCNHIYHWKGTTGTYWVQVGVLLNLLQYPGHHLTTHLHSPKCQRVCVETRWNSHCETIPHPNMFFSLTGCWNTGCQAYALHARDKQNCLCRGLVVWGKRHK